MCEYLILQPDISQVLMSKILLWAVNCKLNIEYCILSHTGAQEFKKGFDEAVAKNTELLGEDPTGEEEQTQIASTEKSPEKSPADELTEKTEKLAVKGEEAKKDDEEK